MARGHQKFQSQQKNAKKQAEIKKSKGHDQKAAAKAALVYTCTVCRVCKSVVNAMFTIKMGSTKASIVYLIFFIKNTNIFFIDLVCKWNVIIAALHAD